MDNRVSREVASVCGTIEIVHPIHPQEYRLRTVFKESVLIPSCSLGCLDYAHHHQVEDDGSEHEKCSVGDDNRSKGGDDGDVLR